MLRSLAEIEPHAAAEDELRGLQQLDGLLGEPKSKVLRVVAPDGRGAALSGTALQLVRNLIHQLTCGQAVTIVPIDRLLTTQAAADLLNVSRPYLVRLLDRGDIPFTKVGTHRRVAFDDLMDYRRRRDAQRHTALRDLTRISQEMGLFGAVAGTETR